MALPAPFAALTAYRRWVTWETVHDPDRPGKLIKRPTDVATGRYCKSDNPAHQYSYAEALATGRPMGFVFDAKDGFWFLDIDGALESPQPGQYAWSALAQEICAALPNALVEVSHSGTGLHVIGRGRVPDHACRNIGAGLELYHHQRFAALTGKQATGDAGTNLEAQIAQLAARWFPPSAAGDIAGWTDAPVPEWGGPADDEELVRAAMASGKKSAAAAFGAGDTVTFADLWTANADVLGKKWPSPTGPYDASMADGSLASHLAYWTGKDHERTRRLMLQSGLARQKWDDRPDWLETTIVKAASVVTNVAKGRAPIPPPDAGLAPQAGGPLPDAQRRDTAQEFVPVDLQPGYFAGCVYVVQNHAVWVPGTGDLLDKGRFDIVYGGHGFPMDSRNEKVTDSAFDAFTRSRVNVAPRADRLCFRPEHPSGAVIEEDKRRILNTYIPVETPRLAGDPTPWTRHLELMLPDERDRSILLHYLASMVQNPGVKFQWWPVVQGAEGNGKTLLDRTMAFCVGSRYSHLVNPEAMAKTGNQFNDWVEGKLYLGVEEIYVGNRREFLETFKATVTNDRLAMEGKGAKQAVGDNRLNGILFTNHKEAVPVSVDTRRYAIFYTAQQSAADIIRDGMGGDYFPRLYDWFYGKRDFAHLGPMYGARVINHHLATMALEAELDPAFLCVRAPRTSATSLAIRLSLGRAEQEVVEAIAQGRVGFRGGWVSSIMLDRLLDEARVPVPRNRRADMMASLGYQHHPVLHEGRVNNPVTPDNGKPALYVTVGHLSANLTDPALVAKAYTAAQDSATGEAAAARFGK